MVTILTASDAARPAAGQTAAEEIAAAAEKEMERFADAADRAADRADRRARDADVTVRWGVALVLGALVALALLMFGGFADVRGEIADVRGEITDVRGEIADVRRELGELSAQIDARFDALLESLAAPADNAGTEGQ